MKPGRSWRVTRFLLTSLYLMVGWLLFTSSLNPRSLLLGIVFSACVGWCTFELFFEQNEAQRRSIIPSLYRLPVYFAALLFRMYVASFIVLAQIATGRINPRVVHFRTKLKSDIARVMLANSITMTPGTIAMSLDDDHVIVHWLDAPTTHSRRAHRLIAAPFERLLASVWV